MATPRTFPKRMALAGAIALLLAAGACNFHEDKTKKPQGDANLANAASDYQYLAQKIFGPRCAKCHNSGTPKAGVNVTILKAMVNARDSHGGVVVKPGDAKGSSLYAAMESGEMPLGGPKTSDEDLQILAAWIDNGASETSIHRKVKEGEENPATDTKTSTDTSRETSTDTSVETNTRTSTDTETTTSTSTDTPAQAMTYKKLQAEVLTPSCGRCHAGDLAGDYAGAMDYVTPGDLEKSELWKRVTSDEDGYKMPPRAKLPQAKLDMVKAWIMDGAKE